MFAGRGGATSGVADRGGATSGVADRGVPSNGRKRADVVKSPLALLYTTTWPWWRGRLGDRGGVGAAGANRDQGRMDVEPVVGSEERDVLRQRGALRLREAQLARLLPGEGGVRAVARLQLAGPGLRAGELHTQVKCARLQLGVLRGQVAQAAWNTPLATGRGAQP